MKVRLIKGDCLTFLPSVPSDSLRAVVTDPPYGIAFFGNSWDLPDIPHSSIGRYGGGDAEMRARYRRDTSLWYEGWCRQWLAEVYRILCPGGIVKILGSPRLFHRVLRVISQVGFERIHFEAWVYPPGIPRSRNISKDLDLVVRGAPGRKAISLRGGKLSTGDPLAKWQTTQGYRDHSERLTRAAQDLLVVPDDIPVSDNAKRWAGYGTTLRNTWEAVAVGRKP